jgi:hypothetical protein
MSDTILSAGLEDGKPCGHPGCLNHVSHPCEGCGRIGGREMEHTARAEDDPSKLDKAACIAATICAHGYLQNTEDEGRVAHVIRQSLTRPEPQADDVETIAEGDEEAGEANLRNSYARTKAMHSKNYASVGDADWDAAVLVDEIDRLRAALARLPAPVDVHAKAEAVVRDFCFGTKRLYEDERKELSRLLVEQFSRKG